MTKSLRPQKKSEIDKLYGFNKFYDLKTTKGIATVKQIEGKNVNSTGFPVLDLSPIGGEFLLPRGVSLSIEQGNQICMNVEIATQKFVFTGLVVSVLKNSDIECIFSVRWNSNKNEKRNKSRWNVDSQFYPTILSSNPFAFNDLIMFQVMDISAEGVKLKTSLRNKYIVTGMRFSGLFTLPMVGNTTLTFEVRWTTIDAENGKEILVLGAEILDHDRNSRMLFGQYAFQFSEGTTLEEIRDSGLVLEAKIKLLNFYWVKNVEEYEKILKLRFQSCKQTSIRDINAYKKMSDKFDAKARILVAKYKGKIAGTTRLVFPNPGDFLEQQEKVQLPEWIPQSSELVEMTKIFVNPESKGASIVVEMLKYSIISAITSKRYWILASSPKSLLPLYKKMGAQFTNCVYSVPEQNLHELTVMVFNIKDILLGKAVSPLMWNMLSDDCVKFARQTGSFSFNSSDKLKFLIFRAIKPLANILKNTGFLTLLRIHYP